VSAAVVEESRVVHVPGETGYKARVKSCVAALLLSFAWRGVLSAFDVPELNFTHRTLENGLAVYAIEEHATPTVAILVWYHVGSKDDPPKRSGFAHLFEHMMFKGTKNTAPETLDRLTEDVGGMNNAFTSDDVTVYHEVVPSHHLERLLWAEADRMGSLIVDDKNFRSEREVVKQEYRQSVDAEPYGRFGEEVLKRSFAVHPYKRTTIGSIPDLDAATLPDVHRFFASHYRPDNATLVVAGDFEPAQLNAWIDQYFAPLEKPSAPLRRVAVKEPPRKKEQRATMRDAAVPLPAFAATFLAPNGRSSDALPLELAVEMLASGESSRLHRMLVYEKGLAQSVEGEADLREDLGLVTFKVVLASGQTTKEVEEVFLSELARFVDTPPSAEELAKAKNRLLSHELRERETNQGKGMALGEAAVLLGDAARVNTDVARLMAITAEEVHEAVKPLLVPQNRLVLEVLPASPEKKGKRK